MLEKTIASATMEQAESLRQAFHGLFIAESITLDKPERGRILFRGYFLEDLTDCFDELRGRFERYGFTPFVRDEDGTALIAAPFVIETKSSRWLINLVLLIGTIISTMYIGSLTELSIQGREDFADLGDLFLGLPYCLSVMAILGAHELGHYFAAMYHKVPVSLPYFIPMPLPPFGTFGAFIRLKAPLKNKRALLDVGAAGPLAGLLVAIPVLLYGLSISPVQSLPEAYSLEGNSILYGLSKLLVKGQWYPSGNQDILLGQIAWAGWVGLFVTGLNLIPVGQLDGGHIAYALFGKRARLLYWPIIAAMVGLVIITGTYTWALWVGLLLVFGRIYAEPLDDVTSLDSRRRWLAVIALILFPLVFVPTPLQFIGPG
jgi:membrane-associated protease RseP (regulator of RpoE activity)